MAKAYSQDLRDRVLAASDAGMKTGQVAQLFAVSKSWVRRVKQRRRETGETTPRPVGGSQPTIDRQQLAELVRQHPDATLAELRERLSVACSLSAICEALKAMKLTLKKKTIRAAEQDRPDVVAKREEWREWSQEIERIQVIRSAFGACSVAPGVWVA